MTNKQIETILTKAIEDAYSSQIEEILNKLGVVEDAVQSAIDGIDYSEVKGMTEKEVYNFYYDWASDCIASVLLTKKENNVKEEIEEVTVEMLDEEFEDPKLSEIQEIEIKKMGEKVKELRVEEVLHENEARFYMLGSNFEEVAKRNYLAGFEFKLEYATLILLGNLLGNDETEVYYMVVSDLSKLSEDIKYFRNKVLSYKGALNPEFEKVELNFSSQKEDFRVFDDIESIEITR